MNRRTGMLGAIVTTASWLVVAAPAWANAVSPEVNPNAAEDYNRMMMTVFGTVFGCFALGVVLTIVFVVLLIVWLVRRDRRQGEAARAAEAERSGALATPPPAQASEPAAAPDTSEAPDAP